MDWRQFKDKQRWAGDAKPSMQRRRIGHAYKGRCIYMITLVVAGRAHLLGEVIGDGEHVMAMMQPSSLGDAVLKALDGIGDDYPTIEVMARQLMPDHVHFVLYVHEPLPVHLGVVINGFKMACNRALRDQSGDNQATLWEAGYNDRILEGPGHLSRMFDYLRKNPQRLAIKRAKPDLFRVQRNVHVGEYTFAAMGNIFLLDGPWLEQVQCSRRLTDQEIAATVQAFLEKAQRGAVLVSPSISPGEKAVMRQAFEHGCSIIVLQENGFAPLAKPGGARFEACADGRLLLLAPWEHHNDRRSIERGQCLELNKMARVICIQ